MSQMIRWTRNGLLNFPWGRFDSIERLVIQSTLKNRLIHKAELFLNSEPDYHAMQVPWRHGIYLYGPSGNGKTAASRAIAQLLNWDHFTIPSHEILDSHLFERALFTASSVNKRVIVIEDIDLTLKKMETEVFFMLLDLAMEKTDGAIWIATTRHPENTPKTQLLRPGRFDESIRIEPPSPELRSELFSQIIDIPPPPVNEGENSYSQWIELSKGLTFSHFEELRYIVSKMRIEKREISEVHSEIQSHLEEQIIAGDRLGGLSDETEKMNERIQHIDSRVLTAALDMSDVFRTLIEKVIGDAANQELLENKTEGS